MPPEFRCNTCTYWQHDGNPNDPYGICDKLTWLGGIARYEDAKATPSCTCGDEDLNNQTLYTAPDFGCVHWKAA
jgi:hypothetical protein